jgi:hypothetical protein
MGFLDQLGFSRAFPLLNLPPIAKSASVEQVISLTRHMRLLRGLPTISLVRPLKR